MCGIFGVAITKESSVSKVVYKKILHDLFILSESRGREASGFAFNDGDSIKVFKTPFPASDLVISNKYKEELNNMLSLKGQYYCAIGHSRLVTDGYEQDNHNNQPVIKKGMVAIHNGIIVNSGKLWQKFNDEQKQTELDSELIPTLIGKFEGETNLYQAIRRFNNEIYGLVSSAIIFDNKDNLLLTTNNGSLYFCPSDDKQGFIFASEKSILHKLIEKNGLQEIFAEENITHMNACSCCLVNLTTCEFEFRPFDESGGANFNGLKKKNAPIKIELLEGRISSKEVYINKSIGRRDVKVPPAFLELAYNRQKKIEGLKRCTKCILPETFPYIEFDQKGVCNYCYNYRKVPVKGLDQFKELCDRYRSKNGSSDCLMPFSGGRDSSYALHFVKKELKMNPIAFSYDWGMITDLARRNQARMCGKLGVEHILISADIRKKRSHIRKNVLAWLKRPSLGMIPLFMAGDKQHLYYTNVLLKENGLRLSVIGENKLEATMFKTGFSGIKPRFSFVNNNIYSLSAADKIKIMLSYSKEVLLNPAYINSSMFDTLDAFRSYYVIKHQSINLFDYIPWDEEKIESTIINEYQWETDPGTITTWRIGDGTAAFYNYIYYFVAGFTENDTFRSNQIREGLIPRDKALLRTHEENSPRWESLKWYCDTIGIDFEKSISAINSIKTLYKT